MLQNSENPPLPHLPALLPPRMSLPLRPEVLGGWGMLLKMPQGVQHQAPSDPAWFIASIVVNQAIWPRRAQGHLLLPAPPLLPEDAVAASCAQE